MRRTMTVAATVLGLLLSTAASAIAQASADPPGATISSTQVRLGSIAGRTPVKAAAAALNLNPRITNQFDGIVQNQANSCGGQCRPSPSVASSGTQLAEVTNAFIQVHTTTGGILCGGGVTLNRLLRTTDQLFDPKIQFDMDRRRFSLMVTVFPASSTAPPVLWVAASDTADACGTWRVYRLGFSSPIQPGSWLKEPGLGQNPASLLFSFTAQPVFTGGPVQFYVFGLPKSTVYSGGGVTVRPFAVAGGVTPASHVGFPMVSGTNAWFVGSIRGQGYRLYRLTNGGGSGAVLTNVPVFSAPWSSPTRALLQPPPGLGGLTLTFGEIASNAWFDGQRVWFTHEVDNGGLPSIRYGAIDTATGSVRYGLVKRNTGSEDGNPSIGVGLSTTGDLVVHLNWVVTQPSANLPASLMVERINGSQLLTDRIGTGALYLVGATTNTGFLFGGYSSISVDMLRNTGALCAVGVQQYFITGGTWRTRIARAGDCPAQ